MLKVKICGITNTEDALMCAKEGSDALGFIFTKKSPRYISYKDAKRIIKELDPFTAKVGVFLDAPKEEVLEAASDIGLDILQFHGGESAAYCNIFRQKFKVIKVFFPESTALKPKVASYKVDAFMFDMRLEDKQKGKKTLPKEVLKEITALIKKGERVIVSGGLNVENVAKVKKLSPYAVDVASGVEAFLGKKDKSLVRKFIRKAKDENTR
jgi:phosphoribosylanthranilate isomerase